MEIELSRILRSLNRFWWIALLCSVVFGGLAGVYSTTRTDSYTVDATVLVASTDELIGNTNTIIELATTDPVLRPALDEYGLEISTEDFARENLNVTAVQGTSIVRIEVTYSDPEIATGLVNGIVAGVRDRSFDIGMGLLQGDKDNLIYQRDQVARRLSTVDAQLAEFDSDSQQLSTEDQRRYDELQAEKLSLEQSLADLTSDIRTADREMARFVDPVVVNEVAVPPTIGDSPSPVILGLAGVIFGSLLGVAIGLLMELRDNSVRDADHLSDVTDGAVLFSYRAKENREDPNRELVLSAMIQGLARRSKASGVALVAPDTCPDVESLMDRIAADLQAANIQVSTSNDVLENVAPLSEVAPNAVSVVFAKQGRSREDTVQATVTLVEALGIPPLGSVLVRE